MSDLTPNSPVAKSLNCKVRAGNLNGLLDLLDVDDLLSPVKVLFTEKGASIQAHDVNKTFQCVVKDYPLGSDYEVDEPGLLVIEPKNLRQALGLKFGKEALLTINYTDGEAARVLSGGSSLNYFPSDESECHTMKDDWVLPYEAGKFSCTMLGGAEPTSIITLEAQSLASGVQDMKVAKQEYVVFNFSATQSTCASGQWGNKATISTSVIDADLEGENCEIAFPDILSSVVNRLNGQISVQKHKETPFFLIKNLDPTRGDVRYLITECQRT